MTIDFPAADQAGGVEAKAPRWRMPWFNALISLVALIGALVMVYPSTASWVSQYHQSKMIEEVGRVVDLGPPSRLVNELQRAHEYNSHLTWGEVVVSPENNKPTGSEGETGAHDYFELLNANPDGVMGRLKIPAIDVDLPIYHGTSDATLAKGVGHLQGTSLPVGGQSQHSVLTAHRGLPSAELFNNLHLLPVGETFTLEIFGEVLTYQVVETQTILPHESQVLFPQHGEDLVTLITCTPLGINSHRYLVTAERITPTPIDDVANLGKAPEIPGFPWWALIIGGVIVVLGAYVWRAGYHVRAKAPKKAAEAA